MVGIEHRFGLGLLPRCGPGAVTDPHPTTRGRAPDPVGPEVALDEDPRKLPAPVDAFAVATADHAHRALRAGVLLTGHRALVEKPLCATFCYSQGPPEHCRERTQEPGATGADPRESSRMGAPG